MDIELHSLNIFVQVVRTRSSSLARSFKQVVTCTVTLTDATKKGCQFEQSDREELMLTLK